MDAPIIECEIDDTGRFKYIQIKVSNKKNPEDYKIIIRGSSEFPYHKYIYRDFMNKILYEKDKSLFENYNFEPNGGGRIDIKNKNISVYGYSTVYGQAEHEKTVEILKKFYPEYNIEWSNEGY